MRATPAPPENPRAVAPDGPLAGEAIVRLARTPGQLEVGLQDLDSLFDRIAVPTYPHEGPMVNGAVAKFMLDTAREDHRRPDLRVTLSFRCAPISPELESGVRAQLSHFFANEAEIAALAQRVNSTEAWGSLRYAIPVVAIAALLAGFLTSSSETVGSVNLSDFAYLVVVVVIWMMVWDPLEKLLFDSYFIRLRIRALLKLSGAEVLFAYSPVPMPAAATEHPLLDSVLDRIEG